MNKYGRAVDHIVGLFEFLDEHSIPPTRSFITGNVGEWLVMERLVEAGLEPVHQSGRNKVDILLEDGCGVEVKASTWSSTYGGVWGFDRIDPDKFDNLVCVALSRDYADDEYFVFSAEEARVFPTRAASRFTSADEDHRRRTLHILEDPEEARTEEMRMINGEIDAYRGAWGKILDR